MTSNFVERVKNGLGNSAYSLWLPGLTAELAEVGWSKLCHDTGLSPSNYGTARVIKRSAVAPRRIVARVPASLAADHLDQILHVEILDKNLAKNYEETGVKFYTAEEISNLHILEQLEEGIAFLRLLPSLFVVTAKLIKSIHLIDSGDDDYDISFSEPQIPFTVFVSIPRRRSLHAALRVTEALVHEAMHLQLTLIEEVLTLIHPTSGKYFSPWRGEFRTARGVLHALYVFRVIDCFFGELLRQELISAKYKDYILERGREIRVQINQVRNFLESPELTDLGKKFVSRLIDIHQ